MNPSKIRCTLRVILGILLLIFGAYFFPILAHKGLSLLPQNIWVGVLRLYVIIPTALLAIWGLFVIFDAMDDYHRYY